MKPEAERQAGYFFAGLGAVTGLVIWAPRAAFSIDGGFEAHARDLSVVFVDLPLILLGGVLLPFISWVLAIRRMPPWAAAAVALAALALGGGVSSSGGPPVSIRIPATTYPGCDRVRTRRSEGV